MDTLSKVAWHNWSGDTLWTFYLFYFSNKNTYFRLLLRNNYQETMDFYCLFVSFSQHLWQLFVWKKITYQGMTRQHLSFWWVWGSNFWWLVSYSICCGVVKPFYSVCFLLVCFKYKNNLVDTWVTISWAVRSHLFNRLYQYWVSVSQWLGFKASFLGTVHQGWTLLHVRFTII